MKFWRARHSSGRIALLTPYDGGNLGDGAIQEALIANFRRWDPNIQLCGITLNPARTSALHGIPCYLLAVTSRPHYHATREPTPTSDCTYPSPPAGTSGIRSVYMRLRSMARFFPFLKPLKVLVRTTDEILHLIRSYRLLRDIDVLVVAGGGQLDDEWGGCWGHPYALLKWTVLSRVAGSSVVFLSVGASLMDSLLTKLFLRVALSLACYRSYRDHESRQLALTIDPRADGPVIPDLAFSLPLIRYESVARPDPTRLRVGVSPIAYAQPGLWPTEDPLQYERYMIQLASFVASLLRRGVFVTLFSSSCPDEQLFQDLRARVGPGLDHEALARLSSSDVTTVHGLLLLLHSVDFVVASRLHGLVLSFLASRPSIAISYDRKVRCLMDELRQADYCFDIQTFNSDDLFGALLGLQSNRHLIAPRLTATRRQYDRLLQPQYSLVVQLLRRRRGGPRRAVTLEELTHESTSDVG